MNDFYEQKARKYKYKYLKLKQEIEGGCGILYESKKQKETRLIKEENEKEAVKKIEYAERNAEYAKQAEEAKKAKEAKQAEDAIIMAQYENVHTQYLELLNDRIKWHNKGFSQAGDNFVFQNKISVQDYVRDYVNGKKVDIKQIREEVEAYNKTNADDAATAAANAHIIAEKQRIYRESLSAAVRRDEDNKKRQQDFKNLSYVEQQQIIRNNEISMREYALHMNK